MAGNSRHTYKIPPLLCVFPGKCQLQDLKCCVYLNYLKIAWKILKGIFVCLHMYSPDAMEFLVSIVTMRSNNHHVIYCFELFQLAALTLSMENPFLGQNVVCLILLSLLPWLYICLGKHDSNDGNVFYVSWMEEQVSAAAVAYKYDTTLLLNRQPKYLLHVRMG